jgi:hypothetical protein
MIYDSIFLEGLRIVSQYISLLGAGVAQAV